MLVNSVKIIPFISSFMADLLPKEGKKILGSLHNINIMNTLFFNLKLKFHWIKYWFLSSTALKIDFINLDCTNIHF